MNRLREFINKSPWIGWALAGVLLVVAVVIYMRRIGGTDPYRLERMTENVTIKFADTGEEITMPRGRLEKQLRTAGSHLDPSKGLVNPKTGQPSGFIFDKSDWEETITRINAEKAEMAAKAPAAARLPPAGAATPTPAGTPTGSK